MPILNIFMYLCSALNHCNPRWNERPGLSCRHFLCIFWFVRSFYLFQSHLLEDAADGCGGVWKNMKRHREPNKKEICISGVRGEKRRKPRSTLPKRPNNTRFEEGSSETAETRTRRRTKCVALYSYVPRNRPAATAAATTTHSTAANRAGFTLLYVMLLHTI